MRRFLVCPLHPSNDGLQNEAVLIAMASNASVSMAVAVHEASNSLVVRSGQGLEHDSLEVPLESFSAPCSASQSH